MKSLVFIVSELGLRAVEAMEWLDVLLDFPDDFVQHYAIAAVQPHHCQARHAPEKATGAPSYAFQARFRP